MYSCLIVLYGLLKQTLLSCVRTTSELASFNIELGDTWHCTAKSMKHNFQHLSAFQGRYGFLGAQRWSCSFSVAKNFVCLTRKVSSSISTFRPTFTFQSLLDVV